MKIERELMENTQTNVIKLKITIKNGKFRTFEKKPPNIVVTLKRPFNIQSITHNKPNEISKGDVKIANGFIINMLPN